ncbi:MAG: hypothetical protein FJ303_18810, partial [Planctomycetes bacterium]|nr:hypothetical protein [Planctomycetota bacterium]
AAAGIVTGGLLTTSSATGTDLSTATNAVTSFNATNSGVGVVNLKDSTGTLTITGISNTTAGGSVNVNNTGGAISITGAVNAGSNAINLTASTSMSQAAAGIVTGGLLTTSSATGTDLSTATNAVTSFNATNSGVGVVNLRDSTPTLTITGISNTTAGGSVDVNNTGGAISLDGLVNAGSNGVDLTASTTITQTGAATTVSTSGNLALVAPDGMGTSGQSLVLGVDTLTSNSSGNNGNQFLAAATTIRLNTTNALNAGNGTITLTSGTFQIQAGAAGNAIANTSPLAVNSPAILDINGNNETVTSVAGNGNVTDTGAAATFTVNNGGADTFAGTFTGANLSLQKTGAGTLTLTGNSTYGGSTTITAGTVANGVANALPTGTALSVTGTFDLAGFNQTVGEVTGAGTVTDSGAAATFTVNNAVADLFAGFLTGSLNLTKTNAGTLTLTGANSYTGTTTVSNGILSVASIVVVAGVSNIGNATSPVVLGDAVNAGALSYTGASATYTRGFTVNVGGGEIGISAAATTLTIASNDINTDGLLTITGTGAMVVDRIISGTGSLAKSNTGALTLNGDNTYGGTTDVNVGTLFIAGSLSDSASNVNLNGASVIVDGGGIIRRPVIIESTATNAIVRNLTIIAGTSDGITVKSGAGNVAIDKVTVRNSKNGLKLNAGYANTTTVTNSTFSTNTAIGIVADDGTLNLTHATVAFNAGGGTRRTAPATVKPKNSLFASNTGFDYSGVVASQGYNLFQSTTGLTLPVDATDLIDVLARLGALGIYGATTLPTHPLLPGSAALDAVLVDTALLATDERGVVRPSPAGTFKDIGAFESQGFEITANTSTATTYRALVNKNVVNGDGSTPKDFSVTVTPKAAGEPVVGGVVTYSSSAAPGEAGSATSSIGFHVFDAGLVTTTLNLTSAPVNAVDNQAVIYNTTGAAIGGLVNGTRYFLNTTPNGNAVTLSATPAGVPISLTPPGAAATHSLFLTAAVTAFAGAPNFRITLDRPLFANGQQVIFNTNGGALPAGLVNGNTYFVRMPNGATPNIIQLSLTSNGAAIAISAVPVTTQTLRSTLDTFKIAFADRVKNAISFGSDVKLVVKQAVVYDKGAAANTAIGGLTSGNTYFVNSITINPHTVQLSATPDGATIVFTTPGTGTQSLLPATRVAAAPGAGSTTITVAAPGFKNGDAVVFKASGGATFGLTDGGAYYVVTVGAGLQTTFSLATRPGGAPITFAAGALGFQAFLAGAAGTAANASILAGGVATTHIVANSVSSAPGNVYAVSASPGGQNGSVAWNVFNQAVTQLTPNAQPQNTLSGSAIKFGPGNASSFQMTLKDQEGQTVVASAAILTGVATSTVQLSALHSADGQTFTGGEPLGGATTSAAIASGTASFTNPELQILKSSYSRPYYLQGSFINPDGSILPQKHRVSKPFRILPFAYKVFAGNFAGNAQLALDIVTVRSDRGVVRLVSLISGPGGLTTNKVRVVAYDSPNFAGPPSVIVAAPQATRWDGPVFLTFSVPATSSGPAGPPVVFPANTPVLMPVMMTAGKLEPTNVNVSSAPNGFSIYATFGLTSGSPAVGSSVLLPANSVPLVRTFVFDLAGFAEVNSGIDPRQNQGFFTRINLGRQRSR